MHVLWSVGNSEGRGERFVYRGSEQMQEAGEFLGPKGGGSGCTKLF